MRLDLEIKDEKRITLTSKEGVTREFLMRPYRIVMRKALRR